MTTNSNNDNRGHGSRSSSGNNASMMDRASGLLQDGIDYVKNNPGKTAAVVGGVAAAAAAYMNKGRISETASGLRDKVNERMGSDQSENRADQNA